jgi:hypothetical protein
MSSTDRQNRLLVNQDWKRIYQSFRNADFQSYDFDNLRRTMINYLRQNYPEDFNDYVESSEYIALIDLIAFLGQNLSFRIDLNARENFLETAERRESVLRLARLLSYNPKRNQPANGLLKVEAIKTTESIFDNTGVNLSGLTIRWNDVSNGQWFEQFTKIMNAALPANNSIGRPLKQQTVDGIPTEQYRINGLNTDVPRFKFTKNVEGVSTRYEVVSTDIVNGALEEEPPLPGNNPALIFRDDGKGAGSSNTGFFMHFRQGKLQTGEFSVASPVANQVVAIDTRNINNSDVWLYNIDSNGFESNIWTKLPSVEGNNIIYNSLLKNVRNVYAVTTRVDDRINLVFSDGVFGNLPTGNFRVYYRTSDNRSSTITPNAMSNVTITIPYVSRRNTSETLTLTLALKYTVSNASGSESSARIKSVAPSTYYTQNRLITAEDYNVGPLGISQEIIKTRSVNRISSGISRYFDLKDVSGKYSTTNLYANDCILYKEEFDKKDSFTFVTQSDVEGVIINQIEPILADTKMRNFYLSKFSKIIVSDLNANWTPSTSITNYSAGYLSDQDGTPYQIGTFTSNSLRLIEVDALCKFEAPAGFHFMEDNTLMAGDPTMFNSKTFIWSKVVTTTGDGTSETGIGFNDFIPQGAILTEIRPRLTTSLTDDVKTRIIDQVFGFRNFALRYDDNERQWKLITNDNINTVDDFSTGKSGDVSGQQLDASWLLYFKTNGEKYTITYRNLRYILESDSEIRFFYDSADKIYDSKTGRVQKDRIRVLNVNRKPDSLESFTQDFDWSVDAAYRDKEGYVDTKKIEITFFDSDDDGVVDNPEIFDQIVNETVNASDKIIFQEKYITSDNTEDYRYFNNSSNSIITVGNQAAVGALSQYNDGQIFYLLEENVFKTFNRANSRLDLNSNYRAFTGRSDLKVHYVHVADSDTRIDPALSNIIDTYILTSNYDTQFRLWLAGELSSMPLPPSSDQLFRSYGSSINAIKSISDEVIYHPVKYKVLFGNKAMSDLQVTFKIVKNPNVVVDDNSLKSDIIDLINRFFSIENWDFGDTFYFQELATYVMNSLTPKLVSIVIVPNQADQSFGSLFQIKSEPDEIFISGATVSDVQVIDEITATKLQASGKVITSVDTTTVGIQSSTNTTNLSTSGGLTY